MRNMKRRGLFLLLALLLTLPVQAMGRGELTYQAVGEEGAEPAAAQTDAARTETSPAREEMIDGIIDLAQRKYEETNGRAQRAQYASDIYICKNFTVYLFNQVAVDYRMAEFPDVELYIPNNNPSEACAPYVYGLEWEDVPAEEGNPFYEAARFRYDSELTDAENRELARQFLMQAQRGDFFQMAANYY